MSLFKPDTYIFCPVCGSKLQKSKHKTLKFERQRDNCTKCGYIYYPRVAMASAAIIIKNKRVLMVQRNRFPYIGTWMFPAGFCEFAEHPKKTAIREAYEETGLKIQKVKFHSFHQTTDDKRAPGHLVFFYTSTKQSGKLKNEPYENSNIAWFALNKLPNIGFLTHNKVAKLLTK